MILTNGNIRSCALRELTVYKRTGLILVISSVYTLIWCVADSPKVIGLPGYQYCGIQVWDYVALSGKHIHSFTYLESQRGKC